jgi:hypothetical protein
VLVPRPPRRPLRRRVHPLLLAAGLLLPSAGAAADELPPAAQPAPVPVDAPV